MRARTVAFELAVALKEAERRGLSLQVKQQANVLQYFDDPVGFIRDCVRFPEGESIADYQLDVIAHIPTERRVAARGPHGIGKTAIAALTIWWFALTRDAAQIDWKIVTTASVWRQLTKFLWPEVHKWKRYIRWSKIERELPGRLELGIQSMRLSYGEAFPVASTDPGHIEGAHADQICYIFDEAKIISDATFDAAEGAFSSGDAYALAISTPGDATGRFFDIHSRKVGFEDWWVRHISLDEAISAGRVNPKWAEQRKAQWGEGSTVYKNRVLGEFGTSQEGAIIPLEWVELANDRWEQFQEQKETLLLEKQLHLTCLGVDVGHGALVGDRATIASCYNGHLIDSVVEAPITDPLIATMELVGTIGGLLGKHAGSEAIIDAVGIGDGVYARALELGYRVRAHNASFGTELTDISGIYGFTNWRSAGWWLLRELLDPTNHFEVALPPNDQLTGELTTPKANYTSTSKIKVEAKEDIRKRLHGRSTDYADAVIHALIGPLLCDEREALEAGTQYSMQTLGSVVR